jgi:hypothetical protein
MDQLQNPFPYRYSKRANVLLAVAALVLIAPVAALPLRIFRELFAVLLKIARSGGSFPS